MQHFFKSVHGLGSVAVTRHAQSKVLELEITEEKFINVLQMGDDIPDGMGVLWREKDGIRLVIVLKPTPFRGAKLVTTVYRVKEQEQAI